MSDLKTELDVMQKIASALEELSDDDARRRVLQWASRLLPPSPAPAQTSTEYAADPAVSPSARRDDPSLSIEGLELFDERRRTAEPPPPTAPAPETPLPAPSPETRAVESKIKSLFSEFQRVAREWKDE